MDIKEKESPFALHYRVNTLKYPKHITTTGNLHYHEVFGLIDVCGRILLIVFVLLVARQDKISGPDMKPPPERCRLRHGSVLTEVRAAQF